MASKIDRIVPRAGGHPKSQISRRGRARKRPNPRCNNYRRERRSSTSFVFIAYARFYAVLCSSHSRACAIYSYAYTVRRVAHSAAAGCAGGDGITREPAGPGMAQASCLLSRTPPRASRLAGRVGPAAPASGWLARARTAVSSSAAPAQSSAAPNIFEKRSRSEQRGPKHL